MAEIREKRLVAALRKRAVTLLARALRKAPGDPDKFTSQLSCSLLLETNLASFRARAAELPEDEGGEARKCLQSQRETLEGRG